MRKDIELRFLVFVFLSLLFFVSYQGYYFHYLDKAIESEVERANVTAASSAVLHLQAVSEKNKLKKINYNLIDRVRELEKELEVIRLLNEPEPKF